eukprot:5621886-Prymnesium_polylepis.1
MSVGLCSWSTCNASASTFVRDGRRRSPDPEETRSRPAPLGPLTGRRRRRERAHARLRPHSGAGPLEGGERCECVQRAAAGVIADAIATVADLGSR